MQKLRGADIVAESLVHLGVEYVIGVPGHTVLDLLDALRQRKDRITAVMVRNEETSGYMADAYYRIKHKPIVVLAHNSVGAANTLTGVMSAMLDSSAMIVITGDAWTKTQGRGAFQELVHSRDAGTADIFRGSVKRSWSVNKPEKLLEVLLKAYKEATSGRPGPVHIDITQEAFTELAEVEFPENFFDFVPNSRTRGDADATKRAFELISQAKRPVVLAGGGTNRGQASKQIIALAQALKAPIVTTSMGKGLVPDSNELLLGVSGWVGTTTANHALRSADVILAFGTRFSETDTAGYTDGAVFSVPPTKIIQIDIDPNEIARYYPVAEGIVGDVAAVAEDLLEIAKATKHQAPEREDWWSSINEVKASWQKEVEACFNPDSDPIEPGRLTREIRKALPKDGIMMTDVGNSQKWIIQQFETYAPDTFITSLGGASMGFGPCGVAGAALAAPGKKVAVITGDGSMSMSLHIFPTVVELNLPIVYIVANDFAWASVDGPQAKRFGPNQDFFTRFKLSDGTPYELDFAAIANACGLKAEKVKSVSDLPAAMERAFAAKGPYLLDVEVRRDTYVPMTARGAYPLPAVE
jgi:acetolactate synthase I/II/III large subunit